MALESAVAAIEPPPSTAAVAPPTVRTLAEPLSAPASLPWLRVALKAISSASM